MLGLESQDELAKGKLSYVVAGVSADFSKQLYSEQFVQRWDTLGHHKWVWDELPGCSTSRFFLRVERRLSGSRNFADFRA